MTQCYVMHEFMVKHPSGSYSFIEVFDMPLHLANRFLTNKYPDSEVQFSCTMSGEDYRKVQELNNYLQKLYK